MNPNILAFSKASIIDKTFIVSANGVVHHAVSPFNILFNNLYILKHIHIRNVSGLFIRCLYVVIFYALFISSLFSP